MKKIFLILFVVSVSLCSFAGASMIPNKAHMDAEITCLDCHGIEDPEERAPQSSCRSCHDDYKGKEIVVVDGGWERPINPHNAHYGDTDITRCTSCHAIHEESRLSCNNCHQFDLKMK